MKFRTTLSFLLIATLFLACIKHEVIPAPTPTVTLKSKFTGTINGSSVELNEGVAGYTCLPTQDKNLLTSPSLSSAIFYSGMSSESSVAAMQIGLGRIYWDAGASADPTTAAFNSFFTTSSNILPTYKDDCSSGFNVTYTDPLGTIYTSSENSVNYQSASFTNISQESDETGDYSKYVCTIDCYVYYSSGPTPGVGLDSLRIQNGQLKGWFKK